MSNYTETKNKIDFVFTELQKNMNSIAEQLQDKREKAFFNDQSKTIGILHNAVNALFNELRAPYKIMEMSPTEPPKNPTGNN